jgi:hypothetical protein
MTRITLTHELGGHRDGDTIDVSPGVAALLTTQGYTTKSFDDEVDDEDDESSSSGDSASSVTRPPQSGKGSGEKAWNLYAESLQLVVPDGATRDDIVALVEAYEAQAGGDTDD